VRCRSNRKNSLVRYLSRRRRCAFIIALVECQILKSLELQDSSATRNATGLQCKDANVRAVQGEADEGDEDEAGAVVDVHEVVHADADLAVR
jgi:hypothetical protein